MEDIIRGVVTRILDGDVFELDVTDIIRGDSDQYDSAERVRVASLSDEMSDMTHASELDEYAAPTTDEFEETGTPEESSIETGEPAPTRFDRVRTVEDLEAHIEGVTVECRVLERSSAGELVCDVDVL